MGIKPGDWLSSTYNSPKNRSTLFTSHLSTCQSPAACVSASHVPVSPKAITAYLLKERDGRQAAYALACWTHGILSRREVAAQGWGVSLASVSWLAPSPLSAVWLPSAFKSTDIFQFPRESLAAYGAGESFFSM